MDVLYQTLDLMDKKLLNIKKFPILSMKLLSALKGDNYEY